MTQVTLVRSMSLHWQSHCDCSDCIAYIGYIIGLQYITMGRLPSSVCIRTLMQLLPGTVSGTLVHRPIKVASSISVSRGHPIGCNWTTSNLMLLLAYYWERCRFCSFFPGRRDARRDMQRARRWSRQLPSSCSRPNKQARCDGGRELGCSKLSDVRHRVQLGTAAVSRNEATRATTQDRAFL